LSKSYKLLQHRKIEGNLEHSEHPQRARAREKGYFGEHPLISPFRKDTKKNYIGK